MVRDELNIGQLAKERFGEKARCIGCRDKAQGRER